ncbi:MAG: RAD55 family ATPase, partial [Burkholderiaceae bacterium]
GDIGVVGAHDLDLSVDETLQQLTATIRRMNAKRVVIDSLSAFEALLAPEHGEDFRESLCRMVTVLTNLGVSLLMTTELEDRYVDLRFSAYGSAFLTDAIVLQRYTEVHGCIERVIAVVKLRGSSHSHELRRYDINGDGLVVGEPLPEYEGLLSGRPMRNPYFPDKD